MVASRYSLVDGLQIYRRFKFHSPSTSARASRVGVQDCALRIENLISKIKKFKCFSPLQVAPYCEISVEIASTSTQGTQGISGYWTPSPCADAACLGVLHRHLHLVRMISFVIILLNISPAFKSIQSSCLIELHRREIVLK